MLEKKACRNGHIRRAKYPTPSGAFFRSMFSILTLYVNPRARLMWVRGAPRHPATESLINDPHRQLRQRALSEKTTPPCNIGGTSAAPRRLDRGDVDLLHAHHRIKRALCFIAASRQRLGQHARRDLPGDVPTCLCTSRTGSPGRHCRRWRSSSGRSLADRQWRSGTRRLRYA